MGDMSTYKGLTSDADRIAYLKTPGNGNLINQLNASDPSFKNWFDSADYATRSGQYDPTTNTNYDTPGAPARSFATPTAAQLTNPAAQQTAPQSTATQPAAQTQAPDAGQSQMANAMARRGNNWGGQGPGPGATRNYSAGQYAPQMPGGGQAPTYNTAQTGQAPTYYGQQTAQPQSYYNAQQAAAQQQLGPQAAAAQLQQLGQAYGNTGGGSVGGKGGGQSSFAAPQASAPGGKGGGGTPGGKGSGGGGYSAALQNAGGTPGGKGGGMATGNMGMGYGQQALNYSA